mgnify:CR=1 FL=1
MSRDDRIRSITPHPGPVAGARWLLLAVLIAVGPALAAPGAAAQEALHALRSGRPGAAAWVALATARHAVATGQDDVATLDNYAVPSASRKLTAPPPKMRAVQGCANVAWQEPDPLAVVNRQTSDWYLDREELLCRSKRALCFFLRGDRRRALADVEEMRDLDPVDHRLTRQNRASNYLRLRDGFRSGRLYASQREIALFEGQARVALVVAEVAFETERWGAAVELYERLRARFGDELSEPARAYLHFALACAYGYHGNKRRTQQLLAPYRGPDARWGPEVPTWYRARQVLANFQPVAERGRHLEETLVQLDESEVAARRVILLKIGQYAYLGRKPERAIGAFRELLKIVPDGSALQISANTYIRLVREQQQGATP